MPGLLCLLLTAALSSGTDMLSFIFQSDKSFPLRGSGCHFIQRTQAWENHSRCIIVRWLCRTAPAQSRAQCWRVLSGEFQILGQTESSCKNGCGVYGVSWRLGPLWLNRLVPIPVRHSVTGIKIRPGRIIAGDDLPMPRSPASLPLSGLFGIVKPSGPTSMHVVDQLKRLIRNSRLFVEEEKLKKPSGKKRARRDNVKIGQGGTLDPLADGVLGQLNLVGNSLCCALNDSAAQWSVLGKARRN
jgi:hypothetical protein